MKINIEEERYIELLNEFKKIDSIRNYRPYNFWSFSDSKKDRIVNGVSNKLNKEWIKTKKSIIENFTNDMELHSETKKVPNTFLLVGYRPNVLIFTLFIFLTICEMYIIEKYDLKLGIPMPGRGESWDTIYFIPWTLEIIFLIWLEIKIKTQKNEFHESISHLKKIVESRCRNDQS